MIPALSFVKSELYHIVNQKRVAGPPPGVWGDLTSVWGDLTGVWGDLTGVRGDLTGCQITDADRKNGIDINTLIGNTPCE